MTDNQRVVRLTRLPTPDDIKSQFTVDASDYAFIQESRKTVEAILDGVDKRMLVVVGPCSIHNYDSAMEYARLLSKLRYENLYVVMRVYFEKPRTSIGWKGFIYDPDLDDTNHISKGLTLARELLVEITRMRVPIGVEFLDTISPQYLADLVSWGAIGARTSESQIHRQLASGLSMPIGFKNLTDGNITKAVEGIKSASYPHTFLGIGTSGEASIVETTGNSYAHLILRGGSSCPNYDFETVSKIAPLDKRIVVDCSHGNSAKDYRRQVLVAFYTLRMRLCAGLPIGGIMIESHLREGCQKISTHMDPGISVTDACLGWTDTQWLLDKLDGASLINPKRLERLDHYYNRHIIEKTTDFNIYINPLGDTECIDKEIIDIEGNPRRALLYAVRLALNYCDMTIMNGEIHLGMVVEA